VLGVLLVAVLMLWSSCSDSRTDAGRKAGTGGSATATASPEPSPSVQVPVVTGSSEPALPSLEPSSAPATPASTECADAALRVTAVPAVTSLPAGAYLQITLKVKNVSAAACSRDLGSKFQEVYLQIGTTKVWSSDACSNRADPNKMTTIEASIEHSFNVTWDGKANSSGCGNRVAPAPGSYQLFARLGTRLSDPVNIQLT
jgi:hypothetical protein